MNWINSRGTFINLSRLDYISCFAIEDPDNKSRYFIDLGGKLRLEYDDDHDKWLKDKLDIEMRLSNHRDSLLDATQNKRLQILI